MAVFLVLACLASSALFYRKTGLIEEKGVFGGPGGAALGASVPTSLVPSALGAGLDAEVALPAGGSGVLLGSTGLTPGYADPAAVMLAITDDSALKDQGSPVGPAFDRSGMIPYAVQSGDNLSRIASYFGISIDTIIGANPGVKARSLKVGQVLNILPTSGVVYTARTGDTLQSIADAFGVSQDKIAQFNKSVDFNSLDPGISVIIPGGKNINLVASASGLANFNANFIMPTDGYNWGILHHYNAVDIANSCGTQVVAAAEGLVVPDESIPDAPDGWNEGYGNFVLLEHPFGENIETRYAHLEKVLVQPGDYVKQGQTIGLMGQTGDASGCHLHFEVIGAQNPFAKN